MSWVELIIVLIVIILIYSKIAPKKKTAAKSETKSATDVYIDLLNQIQALHKKKNDRKMLQKCEQSLTVLPRFVTACVRQYGKFDIDSIPCITLGLRYWSVYGDVEKINKVKEIVAKDSHLKRRGWQEEVSWAVHAKEVSDKLHEYIRENPGTPQNKIKTKIGENDGRMVAGLLRDMENIGRIKRIKNNGTYELYTD